MILKENGLISMIETSNKIKFYYIIPVIRKSSNRTLVVSLHNSVDINEYIQQLPYYSEFITIHRLNKKVYDMLSMTLKISPEKTFMGICKTIFSIKNKKFPGYKTLETFAIDMDSNIRLAKHNLRPEYLFHGIITIPHHSCTPINIVIQSKFKNSFYIEPSRYLDKELSNFAFNMLK